MTQTCFEKTLGTQTNQNKVKPEQTLPKIAAAAKASDALSADHVQLPACAAQVALIDALTHMKPRKTQSHMHYID